MCCVTLNTYSCPLLPHREVTNSYLDCLVYCAEIVFGLDLYYSIQLLQSSTAEFYYSIQLLQSTTAEFYYSIQLLQSSTAEFYYSIQLLQSSTAEFYYRALLQNSSAAFNFCRALLQSSTTAFNYCRALLQHPTTSILDYCSHLTSWRPSPRHSSTTGAILLRPAVQII